MNWRRRAAITALFCVGTAFLGVTWEGGGGRVVAASPAQAPWSPVLRDAGKSAGEPARAPAGAQPRAPGFALPEAGSYRLERILRVPDGAVLDSDGSAHRLNEFTTGRITLFSFIYTYCSDAKGCPLAYATLHALKDIVAHDPALHGKVRLVSMSFDPATDTPATMRTYGGGDIDPAAPVPWHFLTTASAAELAPVLAGFGQDVAVLAPAGASQRARIASHLLKVYLVDRSGTVREIYSTAFLHPLVLRNDVLTLLREQGGVPLPHTAGAMAGTTAGTTAGRP